MSPEQVERARRHGRMALLGVGVLLTVLFAQVTERAAGSGRALVWKAPGLPDAVVFAVGIVAGLGVVAAAALAAVREGRRSAPPAETWWRTSAALLASLLAFGVGTGVFTAWVMEWEGDDEGGLAVFVMVLLGLAHLVANERGRLPLLGIAVAVVGGTLAAALRLVVGGYRTHYSDDALAFGLFFLFAAPFAYLLVRGLLNLVGGGAESGAQAAGGSDVLPLEVAVHEGVYVVTVEAPGLASAEGVEARAAGRTLRLLVPRPGPPPDEVLFTTRPSGRFPLEVELPQELQEPWSVDVARGLVRVRVAPVGD